VPRTFYLASSFHLPSAQNGGQTLARALVLALEKVTGDRCTSRWIFVAYHSEGWFAKQAAVADMIDLARADYVIVVPQTKTSRGTHVEMGLALALDKPTYLWRPPGIEGVAFDQLCLELPEEWRATIEDVFRPLFEESP
jgi:nucleoside 2-deoxyribosyltransferase